MLLFGVWRNATVYLGAVCDAFGARISARLHQLLHVKGSATATTIKESHIDEHLKIGIPSLVMSAKKHMTISGGAGVRGQAMPDTAKTAHASIEGVHVGGRAAARVLKMRTLGDLANTTMKDVASWSLDQFYYWEV